MRLKFAWIIIVLCILPGLKTRAQADISMSTHWNNRANYNPAFIARTDYLYLFANARHQWYGVDGNPRVLNVQASGYFHDMRSAFGLSLVSDKIGLTQAFNPMLNYAYRIAKSDDWSLSMGLSAGIFVRSIDGSLFEAETNGDPSIHYTREKTTRPDANAGFEFQSKHLIFGLSSTHLLSIGKNDSAFLNANHRYGYAIYKNNNLNFLFYKAGLLLVNRDKHTVLEGNLFIRFKRPTGLIKGPREIFDLGLSYRSSRQIALMIGMMISPNLRVGYAFDQSLIPGYNQNGTHEIMLEYRILCKASSTKIRCGDDLFWYH